MKSLYLMSLSLLFILSGCATVLIQPVSGVVPSGISKDAVKNAIMTGARQRNWVPREANDGTIELTLLVRRHKVVVDVQYNTKEYVIVFKSSENMNQNGNAIHRNYRKWALTLKNQIDRNLLM